MDASKIEAHIAGVDEFVTLLVEKATDIATRQAAAAEAFQAEWDDLYQGIPEGRLRTLPEAVGIRASAQSAKDAVTTLTTEVTRFNNLAAGPVTGSAHVMLPPNPQLP